jgi:hypothetical protein
MEKSRAVITLNHGYRPAFFQEWAELFQSTLWFSKMFKHETEKI